MGDLTPLTEACISCFSEQVQCTLDNCLADCLFGSDADCAACAVLNCTAPFLVCAGIYDNDGDGFFNPADCDDSNFDINPDAIEIWYDGVDQNCDGLSDFDQDMDGVDSADHGGTDCDDTNGAITTGPTPWYMDSDMDGYGDTGNSTLACIQPPNMVDIPGDCDDLRDDVYPGAPGTGEDVDNDCNGIIEGEEVSTGCSADYNNDGIVNTTDLLTFLAEFGCESACTVDLDGNGIVNTSDLLDFLSQFGNNC
jgi:hypothetical protein